jgi:hypothetical protein
MPWGGYSNLRLTSCTWKFESEHARSTVGAMVCQSSFGWSSRYWTDRNIQRSTFDGANAEPVPCELPHGNDVTKLETRFSDPNAVATEWDETRRLVETAELFWISTVRADGRPHVTPLVAVQSCLNSENAWARVFPSFAKGSQRERERLLWRSLPLGTLPITPKENHICDANYLLRPARLAIVRTSSSGSAGFEMCF